MNPPWYIAISVCMAAIVFTQLAYAYDNRPRTWRWRLAMFAPAFLLGGLLGSRIAFHTMQGMPALLVTALSALVMGVVFAFLFADNVRYAVPRRKDSQDNVA